MNAQVSKPDHIFDRDREWEGLVRFATSDQTNARLGIVSGRRRQGKTYLLDAVATAFGGFFFTATDSTEADSLADFGRALADFDGLGSGGAGGGRYAFTDWDEALRRLFGTVGQGIIVIDEFPYLMKASPALPSLLQRALGPRGYAQQSRARLLPSGSAMSVMGKLLSGTAPLSTWLFSRRDDPGRPRRVLSLGEAKWDKVMNMGHLERLRRARDLLAVKGYDTSGTKLACYSGAGFAPELVDLAAADPAILLVGLDMLYA